MLLTDLIRQFALVEPLAVNGARKAFLIIAHHERTEMTHLRSPHDRQRPSWELRTISAAHAGVHKNELINTFRILQRERHRNPAASGIADQHGFIHTESVEQTSQNFHVGFHAVRIRFPITRQRTFRQPECGAVVGNDPAILGKIIHYFTPRISTASKRMQQDEHPLA